MFSKIVLCLFFTGATLSAPMTSATNLRSSKNESPRNLNVAKASECTIMVSSDYRILEGVSEHLEEEEVEDSFECEMDATNSESGQMLPLRVSPAQLEKLKTMLKDGDIIPGESKLVHGSNAMYNSDGLFVPPGLDIATNVRKNDGNKRRRLQTIGTKPILVVKVIDKDGRQRSESPAQIGDDVFGTRGDPVNLASQMKACSFGQLNIVPGFSEFEAAPGVIEVTIPISLTTNGRTAIINAVTTAVNAKLGITLPGPYEHVMYVIETCYVGCGWAAYAYINSWMSVYHSLNYKYVAVQMHELGHNFGLAHSGGIDLKRTYSDHTCLMGNPWSMDDVGQMCFNPAKNWQLDWYDDKELLVNPRLTPTSIVNLVGIVNFDTTANNYPVVVKIETGTDTDQFIGFNRSTGINKNSLQAANQVTIVKTGNNGESFSQSWLMDYLSKGESYTFPNWANTEHDLIIKALDIDLVSIPAVATVSITLEGVSTPAPIQAPVTANPSKAPSKVPVTATPTKAPVTFTPSKEPSKVPSKIPITATPTEAPSWTPVTATPTKAPSNAPVTATPTKAPVTATPSKEPSKVPITATPTKAPATFTPSKEPSNEPVTATPSKAPVTATPTKAPSNAPVTATPTKAPSNAPVTANPTKAPSKAPVFATPSKAPVTATPSKAPVTATPTKAPSNAPVTATPTKAPAKSAPTYPLCSTSTSRGTCRRLVRCRWFENQCI